MKSNTDDEKHLIKAQHKLRQLKIFYIHLALYIVVVALISLNFYVMEEGPYTDNITALNIVVLVLWTLFILIHAWSVFKGRFLFNKTWEDKKIEKILKEKDKEETTLWE
ncbi:2TM domain-containing protein [Psychroserpens mesophilus]|uniref:2TM domain-containing protein n=1 Tax=Psychroserpens mesophilus TaxID=325473 RepID=UPI0005916CDC|nr:2TM domain-containing protein [Psychroserpens mesophilus]